MPAGSSERTGCEGARPSAVPVCLRSLRDDTLPEAVQPAAARATAREAATASVPAMWTGAAMSRGLGVTRRWPAWQCAGCNAPLGGSQALNLPDGNRVHFDPIDCLIRFGNRWRGDAHKALVACGLEPPNVVGEEA